MKGFLPRVYEIFWELNAGKIGPRRFGGAVPKKFFVTTPFSLLENEGNAPFMTNYSEKLPKHSV